MKKNKLFKYLFGSLAGVVLAGAVIGGVVSCSNGSTTQTQQTTQSQPASKPTTSTANNTISDYALTSKYNTSTIVYQTPQTQNASEISMVATNSNIANYSTLANEPGNLAIYTNGSATPTAIIDSANATNTTATTTLNLTLQKDSELYHEWENGKITNLNVLATQLGSLISFSPTELTHYHLTINYTNSNYLKRMSYSTTNQPLNFYFTPNNAQWGASTNVPLQAELSLAQNSTTDKDYVAFNIEKYYGSVVGALLNDTNFIFTSTMTINYQVNNKYYSDPITLNVSLQPYFSKTNLWTVDSNNDNSNTYIYLGSDYKFTPAPVVDGGTVGPTTITLEGKGWMFVDLGTAYETYWNGHWSSNNSNITTPVTFDVYETSQNSNKYQIVGNYSNSIILLTPSGLILNNLQFITPINISSK